MYNNNNDDDDDDDDDDDTVDNIPEAPAISSTRKHHIALIWTEIQLGVVTVFQTTAPGQQLYSNKTIKHVMSLMCVTGHELSICKPHHTNSVKLSR